MNRRDFNTAMMVLSAGAVVGFAPDSKAKQTNVYEQVKTIVQKLPARDHNNVFLKIGLNDKDFREFLSFNGQELADDVLVFSFNDHASAHPVFVPQGYVIIYYCYGNHVIQILKAKNLVISGGITQLTVSDNPNLDFAIAPASASLGASFIALKYADKFMADL